MTQKKCQLCEERPIECPNSGLCKRCYAWSHYWVGRSVTDKMKRAQQIEMWNRRAKKALKLTSVRKIA